jgi:hypothetical protein
MSPGPTYSAKFLTTPGLAADEFADRYGRGRGLAARIEERSVAAVLPDDQRHDGEAAGDGVGDALPGIPGVDVDVGAARIAARERHEVDRLQDLARPAIFGAGEGGIARPRPAFQVVEPSLHVDRLARAMVFAADDDQVLGLAERLDAHIMIGFQRIPDERVRDGSLGDRGRR